jgi:ABC-type branched-subunit amino acid transport system ATPase component
MELSLIGLNAAGKTSLVNVLAVSAPSACGCRAACVAAR